MHGRTILATLLAVILAMPVLAQDEGRKRPDGDRPRGDKGGKRDGDKECCACPHLKPPPPPRDGDGPRKGPRDGEGPRKGPRDGDGKKPDGDQ